MLCFYYNLEGSQRNVYKIINDNRIILFMKGDPLHPLCGFSRGFMKILFHNLILYNIYNFYL
jgi:glutaredoxin-related protein